MISIYIQSEYVPAAMGPRNQINPSATADLSFGPPSALHQKSQIDNMLPLARLEDEPNVLDRGLNDIHRPI
jgi:hypothetical protein